MNLSTLVSIPKSEITISHQGPTLLIGSCFSQNMGDKLVDNKFDVNINPNGIIYNPISVVNVLKRIIKNQPYSEDDLTQFNGKWISFDHHGSFSSFDKKDCLTTINNSIHKAHLQFIECNTIFITFGSAWVYEYPDVGVVANCHKIPNKKFEKRLLSVKEAVGAFNDAYDELKIINPNINIVFTVSPIRHVRDGLHENNLSKSVLHLVINEIIEQHKKCHYFPAYELVIDELRDYRFFGSDLVHPTETAINFVWEKFAATYCDENTKEIIETIQKIKTAVNHRPFNFDSEEHQQFIAKQIQIMDAFSDKHPFINFEAEKEKVQRK